jgi:hypothetical protein
MKNIPVSKITGIILFSILRRGALTGAIEFFVWFVFNIKLISPELMNNNNRHSKSHTENDNCQYMTQAKSRLPAALADQYGTFECAISAIMLIKNPRYKMSPINPRSIKTRKTVECG